MTAAIEAGTFNYGDFFPESKNVTKFGGVMKKHSIFKEVAEQWMKCQNNHELSTFKDYVSKLKGFWIPAFGDKVIGTILTSQIREQWAKKQKRAQSTQNGYINVLRLVFLQMISQRYGKWMPSMYGEAELARMDDLFQKLKAA